MVSSGGGSALMIGGASRARSCGLVTPSSTLHGSFLRDLPTIHVRSSSLSAMPSASREDGEHSGSLRASSSCCTVCRLGTPVFSTAGSDVVAISMAAISLPRQLPTSSCEVLTVSAMLHEMVERVTPESAVGRGGSASPSTMPAIREATSSPRLPRSAMRLAP